MQRLGRYLEPTCYNIICSQFDRCPETVDIVYDGTAANSDSVFDIRWTRSNGHEGLFATDTV